MDPVISKANGLGSHKEGEIAQNNSSQVEFVSSSRYWISNLTPICFIIGVACNAASIKIFRKSSMLSSTNVYLVALSVSDLLNQIFSFTISWKYYRIVGTMWLYWRYTPFGLWLTEASRATSTWIVVSFTVERYIAVYHHLKRQIFCTEKLAMYICCSVFLCCFSFTGIISYDWRVAIGLTDGIPINETVRTLERTEAWENEKYQKSYHRITMVYFFLIPIVIIGVSNYNLVQFVRSTLRTPPLIPHQRVYAISQWQIDDNQVTKSVIAVSMMYIIWQLPSSVLNIYALTYNPLSGSTEESILLELRNILNLMGHVNPICNFLLYIGLNKDFRKYFHDMFPRRRVTIVDTSTPSTTRVRYSVGSRLSGPSRAVVERCNIRGGRR